MACTGLQQQTTTRAHKALLKWDLNNAACDPTLDWYMYKQQLDSAYVCHFDSAYMYVCHFVTPIQLIIKNKSTSPAIVHYSFWHDNIIMIVHMYISAELVLPRYRYP